MERTDLALTVVVTGAHLSPLHGGTALQIAADGVPVVEKIESLLWTDSDSGRLKGAANQLQVLAHSVSSHRPDILLVSGDREEALTMAVCGAYLNIPTVHYAAGDVAIGNVDDTVRHAVSRLSHVLLTTHEEATERLIRSGEEPWRVHTVGHAGIDRLRTTPSISSDALAEALGVDKIGDRYVVVIQHPLSSEIEKAGEGMEATLAAIRASGLQAFVIYPNSDPGTQAIGDTIDRYANLSDFHAYRNIPDVAFVNLLRGASALIGNSSLGLLEAPFLQLPAINVGNRQLGRCHTSNVRFVAAEQGAVEAALEMVLNDSDTISEIRGCGSPFGDGLTGPRVAQILATTNLGPNLLQKQFTY